MLRPRSILIIPRPPGGYIDHPPDNCPYKVFYNCDNPLKYDTIPVVNYCCCFRCKEQQGCERKVQEDKGARHRIARQKNGGCEE